MVGRLIEMKGVHIAIAALSQPELSEWELHVVGDGPMRDRLEQAAIASGVAARVTFHGKVARQQVYEYLENATCSLLLSTHDAAGWAAAESIAVGTPVHTWSHGGPAELVSSTGCGSATDPRREAISTLAAAISEMEVPPRADMSRFYFDAVVEDLRSWYEEATQ
jgi:glycosyltransferase involved in cell wall biosynthesis